MAQRGPDRVGARAGLRPQHALLEGDALGAVAHARVTLEPEDPPRRVDDDHDVLGVQREAAQAVAQHLDAAAQRRGVAAVLELVAREGAPRMQVIGVEPGADHAPPRLLDDGPHAGLRVAAAQRRLPRATQTPGVRAQVGGRVDRDEGIAHRLLWPAVYARRSLRTCP
jgi:hypothetical protein